MQRRLIFQPEAKAQLADILCRKADPGLQKQVLKALSLLESDLRHPGLQTHKYLSLRGANDEDIYEAYVQNNTPSAYRIFFHYGPDELIGRKRVPVLTIVAITLIIL